ncbi:branched-chain alpha-keto acid dehydrogenase E2 subunit [Crocosphaera chwakensis CCY0110]|uniref:Branched-chain alpha-keto acid dehydrogenase E2 subunit n=1 Tax=Crocosphaera chwakensis CCY0110 TaxID=391612 RepID=A3II32_9CHRO|nr:branched-chain alpha-keto acid dehydrogenase E2 subunit [Crocosphaera chwakensis CCY0110]
MFIKIPFLSNGLIFFH